MAKGIANRWTGPGSAYPRGLFAAGELGCWFDCNLADAYTDTGRTTPASVGAAVAGLTGRSGVALHAAQASSGLCPVLARCPVGGRRNLLTWSADQSNAAWTKNMMTVGSVGDGSFTLTDTAVAGYHVIYPVALPTDGGSYARTVDIKKGTARYVSLSIAATPSGAGTTWIVDLDTGTFTQTGTLSQGQSITALGGGWYRVTIIAASSSSTTSRFAIGISPAATGFGAALQYTGIGDTLIVRNAQAEAGTTATAFQKVTTIHDVTEAGKRDLWHLYSDLVDDSLPVTLPDLGATATLFYAVDGSTAILPAQTIGAGAFATLRAQRTFAVGAINRALTSAETTALTAYLNARRGA